MPSRPRNSAKRLSQYIEDLDHKPAFARVIDVPKIAYSYEEAAKAVSLHPSSIRKEIRRGRLGFTKYGSRTLIGHDELVRWFNSLPTGPPGP